MSDLPPLIDAEVELDGVRIVLESPKDALPPFAWVSVLGVVVLIGLVVAYQASQLPVVVAIAGVALAFVVVGVRAIGPIEPEDIVLEVRRGRLTVDDRELETWDVQKAWWDCEDDVSTLMLERTDTVERVVTVRRQTHQREGVTRRQREWIADLITRGVEPATAADIPEGIRQLRRRQAYRPS